MQEMKKKLTFQMEKGENSGNCNERSLKTDL